MKRFCSRLLLAAGLAAMALLPGSDFLAAAPQQKQQPPSARSAQEETLPTINVEVNVVNIFFTVRNKQGGIVSNLDKSDFTISEEGQPQTIQYFSRQTDVPLTLGLLVDTSASQGNLLDLERQASSQFLSQVLRVQKDQAFLISFDVDVDLLQDLTDSTRLLRDGLNKLRINGGVGGFGGGPVPSSGKPRGTLLYDGVYLASDEVLKTQPGRKAIVLITDGVDQGSRLTLQQAVAAAQKSDVIIYSILYEDRGFYYRQGPLIGFGGGASELKKMGEETGGRMFEVSKKTSLKMIFDELQEELRSQYSIGYTPPENRKAGNGFRRIKIEAKNRELKVQARQGYYPKGSADSQ